MYAITDTHHQHECLSLSLFVFGVFTDHPDHPFSFYNLTLVADFFDRCPDLHSLFLPKNNSSPRQIIRGKFHRHLVSWEDFDEVHSHLSRNMCQHLVAVFQFYSEHGIGKGFQDLPFHLDRILLRHSVSIRTLKRARHLINGRFDQKFDRGHPALGLSEVFFYRDNTR